MTIVIDTGPKPVLLPRMRDPAVETAAAQTGYYGIEVPDKPHSVWRVEGGMAKRLGVSDAPQATKLIHFPLAADELFEEAAAKKISEWFDCTGIVERMALPPGQFYARISRPLAAFPTERPFGYENATVFPKELASLQTQLTIFVSQLERLFSVIEPSEDNMHAYGHEIRNFIILVTTEVEAQFRAILRSNLYPDGRWNTKYYVKLDGALRLAEYGVALPKYPWIEPIAPFRMWDATQPTSSLNWYDDYNAVKHDREASFPRATLASAISAISALAVIAAAQFGIKAFREGEGILGEAFSFVTRPRWTIGDCYHSTQSPTVCTVYPFE